MIDTKSLEAVIEKTKRDKGVIHSSVKRVDKSPLHLAIDIWHIDTVEDKAQGQIVMAWNVGRFDRWVVSSTKSLEERVGDILLESSNTLRLKWFRRVHEILQRYGDGAGIDFVADYDNFEFGVGEGCVWGALPITAIYVEGTS